MLSSNRRREIALRGKRILLLFAKAFPYHEDCVIACTYEAAGCRWTKKEVGHLLDRIHFYVYTSTQ